MASKMKKLLFLIVLIVLGVLFTQKFLNEKLEEDENLIRLSGNIEVIDAEVSAKIAERVRERLVDEGETVKKGQLIARMEDKELLQEVAFRKAELQAATAELDELLAGSRPEEIAEAKAAMERTRFGLDELLAGSRPQEIAASEANVESAEADLRNAEIELKRYKDLFEREVVSEEQYDNTRTRFEMAEAKLKLSREQLKLVVEGPRQENIQQADAALKEATERYHLVKKGPRVETIEQARARLEQTQAALDLAKTRVEYTLVFSPLNGVVLSKNIEPGEYVAPGTPIITIGDLENVWFRGYVNETDLIRVKVGQKALVKTDTYPDKVYEGRLSFISSEAEFTPKSVQTEKERVKLVYRVKVNIHNPNMDLKPGMPVDADILLGKEEE